MHVLFSCVYSGNIVQDIHVCMHDMYCVGMYMYCIDTRGSGVTVVLTEVTGTETTVMGLTPAAYYTFLVTAENDVSFQDSNVNVRSVNVTATTEQGGMYTQCKKVIVNVSVHVSGYCTVYLCVTDTQMFMLVMLKGRCQRLWRKIIIRMDFGRDTLFKSYSLNTKKHSYIG